MSRKEKKSGKRRFRIKLRLGRKIMLVILLGLLLYTYCMIRYTGFVSELIAEKKCTTTAQATVRTIAEFVDGDQLRECCESGKTDAYYDNLAQILKRAKYNSGVTYLYLIYPYDGGFVYLMEAEDMEEQRNPNFTKTDQRCTAKFGDVYEYEALSEDDDLMQDVRNKTYSDKIICPGHAEGDHSLSAWAPVIDSKGDLVVMVKADYESLRIEEEEFVYTFLFLFIVLFGIVVFMIVIFLFTRGVVSKPMKRLTQEIAAYQGEAIREKNVRLETGDEIEVVYDNFYELTYKLQKYIEDIARMTSENERISAELNIAAQIQESVLPAVFPAFPDKEEIDIYALMHPAKEVGGDFYDFFLVDEDHLAVVVADVSGKGIPAALFMMISKSFIKNQVLEGKHVDEVFCEVNNQLCENNNENFFVTAWLGILDLKSGTLEYVNAGHNPPAILRKNGSVEWIRMQPGLVLAAMEDVPYFANEIQLERGDRLLLYTDGVTEATNEQEEMYGEERMERLLADSSGRTVTETVMQLREDIREFVGEAQQYDDITILEMAYRER